jgi:hypothetical protein
MCSNVGGSEPLARAHRVLRFVLCRSLSLFPLHRVAVRHHVASRCRCDRVLGLEHFNHRAELALVDVTVLVEIEHSECKSELALWDAEQSHEEKVLVKRDQPVLVHVNQLEQSLGGSWCILTQFNFLSVEALCRTR